MVKQAKSDLGIRVSIKVGAKLENLLLELMRFTGAAMSKATLAKINTLLYAVNVACGEQKIMANIIFSQYLPEVETNWKNLNVVFEEG